MARFFRRLMLMAAQGGPRYIRAIIRVIAASLRAKVTAAPGASMEAHMENTSPHLTADAVARPVADIQLHARGGLVRVTAHVVAWLVSEAVAHIRTAVEARADIAAAPAADMRGDIRVDIPAVVDIEASPGVPGMARMAPRVDLTADAETAPPSGMAVLAEAAVSLVEATAATGGPVRVAVAMAAEHPRMEFSVLNGSPAAINANIQCDAASVVAKMHTWRGPTRDGSILYIPQVYAYERVGNNIKIM